MSEREIILIALVKEVLGPRNGNNEILPADQNPRDEFITGILAPAKAPQDTENIEGEFEDIGEEVEYISDEEDQGSQGYAAIPGIFSPALNPKELPRSIGLSFTVEANNNNPQIEICATWARYQLNQHGWQRHPDVFISGVVSAARNNQWTDKGISLHLRTRRLSGGAYRVSIYLVNVTEIPDDVKANTPDYIFQPQIRVHCCSGTTLVPVQTNSSGQATTPGSMAEEDESLNLLYQKRTAYARGHLCGATWREIDPERPYSSLPTPSATPFVWTDASLVSTDEQQKFSPADVRTEFVPCYPIETPEMGWPLKYGASPVLDPETLAETWQPEKVHTNLQPLVDGYQAWITGQQELISTLTLTQQPIAQQQLQQCQRVSDRLQHAVEILSSDEDARLAFCFANKAMALQSRWARRGQSLHWRPFQLAFILLNIPPLVDPLHPDRRICDLLWFPTGGGKTEAYLGLAAFILALRRRCGANQKKGHNIGAGVGVFSRYTLRLLTIQQFRRALGMITACEYLRVANLDQPDGLTGWRPKDFPKQEKFIWGGLRFSAGLWVGGNVTPNNLLSAGPMPSPNGGFVWFVGALDSLRGVTSFGYDGPDKKLQKLCQQTNRREVSGEAAQILNCPCCQSILAVPDEGLQTGQHTMHFVMKGGRATSPPINMLLPAGLPITIDSINYYHHNEPEYHTLSITFTVSPDRVISAKQIDEWWYETIVPALGKNATLVSARPSRPGYFILSFSTSQKTFVDYDFDLYCPNPTCELNQHVWAEAVPLSTENEGYDPSKSGPVLKLFTNIEGIAGLPFIDQLHWQPVLSAFKKTDKSTVSSRIPIPACTVDDQVYHRCPSLVIATVDKFARLAFEPKAASLFGNIDHYHSRWGYYRIGSPPSWGLLPKNYRFHPPDFAKKKLLNIQVQPFAPPDLILQDELHLIEGPLGSMVGLYETAVDLLCQRQQDNHTIVPKYVASTATVRQAGTQVQALFDRNLMQFPPSAISSDDRFFATDQEVHPLNSKHPGRLYVAICAPGKGAQTPIVRIWSSLLQSVYERWQQNSTPEVDQFWTLVGYFNAIRELAGVLSLYRQDIPERMTFRAGTNARSIPEDRRIELSSRRSSLELPGLLKRLDVEAPAALDAAMATSMFGTGVDINRLGLMVVHGQPKTTASYIQATGRVGRQGGGLIITFFRASRPRDLDHYEFFTGYHRALYRHVEPITVAPFSPRARERGLGPLAVILLRQAHEIACTPVSDEWRVQQRLSGAYYSLADRMANHRNDPEVEIIPGLLELRANHQPEGRRPAIKATEEEALSELDRWASLARLHPGVDAFVYYEPTLFKSPERHVVLGDAHHRFQGFDEAYKNTPQSLREVEETAGFKS